MPCHVEIHILAPLSWVVIPNMTSLNPVQGTLVSEVDLLHQNLNGHKH